jgi:chemotaxis protein CheD
MVVVGIADLGTANDPASELVTYSLGSGLAIVAFDHSQKIGGLLHALLPDSTVDPVKARLTPHLFVDTGIPALIQAMTQLGANRTGLVLKIAGGAQFLDEKTIFNIGERNCQAARKYLAQDGFAPQNMDIGGKYSRNLRLELSTGRVTIQSPGSSPYIL